MPGSAATVAESSWPCSLLRAIRSSVPARIDPRTERVTDQERKETGFSRGQPEENNRHAACGRQATLANRIVRNFRPSAGCPRVREIDRAAVVPSDMVVDLSD